MPRSPFDQTQTDLAGDVVVYAGSNIATIQAVTSNNSVSSFIANNVLCGASVQTIITSVTLETGKWDVSANVSAYVNALAVNATQEVALIAAGAAASTAYASAPLAPASKATEAIGALSALVTVTTATVVDLVGWNTGDGVLSPSFTALASTEGGSYGGATGITAVPVV